MVTRTRLNITLYICCLSSLFFFVCLLSSLSVGETEHVTVFISPVPRRTIRDVPGIQKYIDYEENLYHRHIRDLCGPYKMEELSRLAQPVSFLFFVFGKFPGWISAGASTILIEMAKEYLKIGHDHFLTHCVQRINFYRIFRQRKCNAIHVTHAPCICLMRTKLHVQFIAQYLWLTAPSCFGHWIWPPSGSYKLHRRTAYTSKNPIDFW